MANYECPDCDSKVQTTPKRYYEDDVQFEAWCPVCNVWWFSDQLDNDDAKNDIWKADDKMPKFVVPVTAPMLRQIKQGKRTRICVETLKGNRPICTDDGYMRNTITLNGGYAPVSLEVGMSMQFNSPKQLAIDAQIVSIQIINNPTDADARKEGFETAKTLKGYWQKHGLLEGAKIIWAIDFILSEK